MPRYCPRCGEALHDLEREPRGTRRGEVRSTARRAYEAKPKRKVSAYHKRLGIILKRLKKKHTLKNGKWRKGWSQRRLMNAAHKEAKRK